MPSTGLICFSENSSWFCFFSSFLYLRKDPFKTVCLILMHLCWEKWQATKKAQIFCNPVPQQKEKEKDKANEMGGTTNWFQWWMLQSDNSWSWGRIDAFAQVAGEPETRKDKQYLIPKKRWIRQEPYLKPWAKAKRILLFQDKIQAVLLIKARLSHQDLSSQYQCHCFHNKVTFKAF